MDGFTLFFTKRITYTKRELSWPVISWLTGGLAVKPGKLRVVTSDSGEYK